MTADASGAPVVEGYDQLRQIGRGGFATVYRARQTGFDRVVALKVLDLTALDETARSRFERECRAIGALSWHPNIVVVHDSGVTDDGRLFLAMEHLEAGSLADRVRADGPLPWPDVVRAGIEVSGALETAHQAGTLHRDLKPDNLLVGVFGEAKLGDFGIAAVEGGPATATGNSALTVLYAAPEVLRGGRGTVASDVYSLASTLHTLLAGRAAFARATDESVAATVLRAVSEPAPDLRPLGVPDDLAAVIDAAMAKDPADRPGSAAELGRALQRVQQAHGLAPTALRLDPRRAQEAAADRGDDAPTVLVGDQPSAAPIVIDSAMLADEPADPDNTLAPAGSIPPEAAPSGTAPAASVGAATATGPDPAASVGAASATGPDPVVPVGDPATGDPASGDPGAGDGAERGHGGDGGSPGTPARRALVAAAVVALLLAAGAGLWLVLGRSDGGDDEAAVTTSTVAVTSTTAVATSSTAAQSTTPTTATPATTTPTTSTAVTEAASPFIATTPEEAAEGLLAAWTVGDSEGASLYAEQSVIADLFVRPTGGAGSTFQGCVDNGDFAYNCSLSYEGGATNFVVSAPPGGRFRVTSATSIAD